MDLIILTFLNQTLSHPLLDSLMVGLSTGGLALLPLGGLVLLAGRNRKLGLAILASLAAALAFALVFQGLALRPRPNAVRLLLPTPGFPSFPSGHAAMAFAAATVVGLYSRQARGWAASLVAATLIGLSRVYLGLHYPSDIVAGAILGAGVGAAGYGLVVARQAGPLAWKWLLWPQIALALVITQMAYLDLLPLHLLRWPLADKVLHFLLIGSIAFWLNLWWKGRSVPVWGWAIPLALVVPLLVALLEELAQQLSPLRTADITDLLSDLAGLAVFWWLSQKLLRAYRPARPDSQS